MNNAKHLAWNSMGRPGRALHRLFRKWQGKNRALSTLYSTDLLLIESHLLLELSAAPNTTPRELCELFGLKHSSITRMIGRLMRRNLLKSVRRRGRRRLLLTPRARATIRKIDHRAEALLRHFCRSLSTREVTALCGYISRLFDGYPQPAGASRKSEHPLRLPQRRIARCLGFTRSSLLACGVAVSHWHVLAEMAESPKALTPSELAARLSLQPAVLSTILSTLRRRGCIRYEESRLDRRSVRTQITARGLDLYERVESAGAEELETAMRDFSAAEIRRLIALTSRLLEVPPDLSPLVTNGYRIEALEDEALLVESRQRWLTARKSSRRLLPVPAALFSRSVAPLALYQGSKLRGALQCEEGGDQRYVSAWWTDAAEPITQEFLRVGSDLP